MPYQGENMANQGKHSHDDSSATSTGSPRVRAQEQSQLEFELEFFGRLLERNPDMKKLSI